MDKRYEIKTGKFGQYFFDTQAGEDMPLESVLNNLNRKEQNERHPVLDITFEAMDLNKTLSVKGYLKELLFTLITEQEGFSGKRPFGESGWTHGMEKALVENKLIDGELDQDGYLERSDSKAFIRMMIGAIKEL